MIHMGWMVSMEENFLNIKDSPQPSQLIHSKILLMCSDHSLVAVLIPLAQADTSQTSFMSTATFTKDSLILILSTALQMCLVLLQCFKTNQPLINLQTTARYI